MVHTHTYEEGEMNQKNANKFVEPATLIFIHYWKHLYAGTRKQSKKKNPVKIKSLATSTDCGGGGGCHVCMYVFFFFFLVWIKHTFGTDPFLGGGCLMWCKCIKYCVNVFEGIWPNLNSATKTKTTKKKFANDKRTKKK